MDEVRVGITNPEALEKVTKIFNSHLEEIALSIKEALARQEADKDQKEN